MTSNTREDEREPLLLHETKALNPWQPEADPVRIAVLGKLAEELAECAAAVARCQIQGIDEREPVTGKLNREWLWQEIADVAATTRMAVEHFGLSEHVMNVRARRKMDHLHRWHELIRAKVEGK